MGTHLTSHHQRNTHEIVTIAKPITCLVDEFVDRCNETIACIDHKEYVDVS